MSAKKIKELRERRQHIIEQVRERTEIAARGAKPRPCGECQACCHVIAVHLNTSLDQPEDKPNYTTCKHQCDSGCAIYNNRPTECRTYHCLWSVGYITNEDYRPDKLGVILDFRQAQGEQTGREWNCIVFWETRPGALQEPNVKRLITWCRLNLNIKLAYNEYNKVKADSTGRIRKPLL